MANVYLRDMANVLADAGKVTDSADESDGTKGADTARTRDEAAGLVRRILTENSLTVNLSKEQYSSPGETWSFPGIGYEKLQYPHFYSYSMYNYMVCDSSKFVKM